MNIEERKAKKYYYEIVEPGSELCDTTGNNLERQGKLCTNNFVTVWTCTGQGLEAAIILQMHLDIMSGIPAWRREQTRANQGNNDECDMMVIIAKR